MTLLSRIPIVYGGPERPLNFIVRSGYCADDLYKAIQRFQEQAVITMSKPDGMVSPTGPTMVYLNRLAALYDPVTTPGLYTDDQVHKMYGDTIHDVAKERINANAPEYRRKVQRDQDAAKNKWKKWKEQILRDGKGGQNARLAVDYLNDEERIGKSNTSVPFLPWALGFGEAFIGYDYSGGWERVMMWREKLLSYMDKRILLVNTWGMTRDMPIILQGNFSHYVMKKNEVREFRYVK